MGNFPGTTVTATRGRLALPSGREVELTDVPGTFSLAAGRPDERVAIDAVLGTAGDAPQALVVVGDGPRLLRSLYLLLQLLELGLPAVLVVNLMDEVRSQGLTVDLDALAAVLGIPVVGTVARRGEGLDQLRTALDAVLADPTPGPVPELGWSRAVAQAVETVAGRLPPELEPIVGAAPSRREPLARWLLLSADEAGRVPGIAEPQAAVLEARAAADAEGHDLQGELVATRYAWIDAREPQFMGEG